MKRKKVEKAGLTVANGKEMNALVEESLKDLEHYSTMLKDADNKEEQILRIKQLYFHNLKQSGNPLALSQKVLADLLTRVEVNKILGKDVDPLSRDYLRVLEEVRKTLKLVKEIEGKSINVRVQRLDDSNMKIVDNEVMEAMFDEN